MTCQYHSFFIGKRAQQKGSGLLLALFLLTALSLLMSWYVYWQVNQYRIAAAQTAGELFAHNVLGAHRYVRDRQTAFMNSLPMTGPVSIGIDTLKTAGYIPTHLREDNKFQHSIEIWVTLHSDGTPMAWVGVSGGNRVPDDLINYFITGGTEAGLNPDFWQAGDSGNVATLGLENGAGMPWTTTADAIPFNPEAIYRYRFPGKASANQMDVELSMGDGTTNHNISLAEGIDAASFDLSGLLRSDGTATVSGHLSTDGDVTAGSATVVNDAQIAQSAQVLSTARTQDLETNSVTAPSVTITDQGMATTVQGNELVAISGLMVGGEAETTGTTTDGFSATNGSVSAGIDASSVDIDRLATDDLTTENLDSPSGYNDQSNVTSLNVNTCTGCPDPGGP